MQVLDHALNFYVTEVLGEHAGSEHEVEENSHLSKNYSGLRAMHNNCGGIGTENPAFAANSASSRIREFPSFNPAGAPAFHASSADSSWWSRWGRRYWGCVL